MIPSESYVYAQSSEPDKKSEGSPLFWKVLLVVVGIILFFQYRELFRMILDSFWGSGINVVFSLLLIGVGVYLLYFRRGVKPSTLEGNGENSLHLSTTEKKIFGLCGGIAKSLQIDVVIIRFLWIFGTFLSAGTEILLYLLLSFILPKPPTMSKESV
jgi:phage shock protein PspC (stress-responsive transcriptional regulator)